MSEASTPDISKIVSLIMENPKLIEQIAGLVKSESPKAETVEAAEQDAADTQHTEAISEPVAEVSAAPTYAESTPAKKNRSQLLCAFKPYVSSERAKAIDSMISIAEILDVMRR